MLFSEPFPMSDAAPQLDGDTLELTVTVARPDKSSFAGRAGAIGAAVVIRGDDDVVSIRWSGYAASEDMGRAAPIAFALKYIRQPHQRLMVNCRGLDALEYIQGARLRGGRGTGKNKNKPFAGFPLFDAVEAACGVHWSHHRFEKNEKPSDLCVAQREADAALDVANGLIGEFDQHRVEHPDWRFLEGAVNEFPEVVARGTF